jgi:hypothetical protein
LIDKIKENLKSGVNNDGETFHQYSRAYAKEKGQNLVDMKDTGLMIQQLKARLENGQIKIAVVGSRAQIAFELCRKHNWNFLAWGKLLAEVYDKVIREEYEKLMNGGK